MRVNNVCRMYVNNTCHICAINAHQLPINKYMSCVRK